MTVFISHTSKDKKIAVALAKQLNERGINVIFDKNFLPGSNIESQAKSLLNKSDAIIAILSEYSFSSEWVRKEIDVALFNEKFKNRFFPVFITKNSKDLKKLPWILQKIQHLRVVPDQPPNLISKKIAQEFELFIKQRK